MGGGLTYGSILEGSYHSGSISDAPDFGKLRNRELHVTGVNLAGSLCSCIILPFCSPSPSTQALSAGCEASSGSLA